MSRNNRKRKGMGGGGCDIASLVMLSNCVTIMGLNMRGNWLCKTKSLLWLAFFCNDNMCLHIPSACMPRKRCQEMSPEDDCWLPLRVIETTSWGSPRDIDEQSMAGHDHWIGLFRRQKARARGIQGIAVKMANYKITSVACLNTLLWNKLKHQ